MVQLVQICNLLHDIVYIFRQFDLVHHFYCDFQARIMLVPRFVNFAEGTSSKHFRVRIDVVILLQLMDTLLSLTLEHSLLAQRLRWSNQLFLKTISNVPS